MVAYSGENDVFTGKASQHKQYVYGAMTTKGIINGNDCYPIRSIRSRTHKLILNLQHDQPFSNACIKSREFQSMIQAATTDPMARLAVDRYQNRPAVEFYDVVSDPLEMNNLACQPGHAETIADLRTRLESWMQSQGDKGVETELVANHHKQAKKKQKRK